MTNGWRMTAAFAWLASAVVACGSFEAAPDSPAGADGGVTDGGDGGAYRFQRRLSIKNPGTTPLPAGHVVCALLAARGGATLVENKSAREDLGDVRLFGPEGEIARVADLRGASVVVCGRLVRPIGPNASDDAYSVRYGDPNATPPTTDPSTVFDVLYDSFEEPTLRSHWKIAGPPKVEAGALVLVPGSENTVQTSAPGLEGDVSFEARVRITKPSGAILGTSYRWWIGFQDLGNEPPWSLFISRDPGIVQAEHVIDESVGCVGVCRSGEHALDDAYHVYRIDRAASTPAGARFTIDGVQVHSVDGPTKPMSLIFKSYFAEGDVLFDWVRARRLAKPEPEVVVGEEEQR